MKLLNGNRRMGLVIVGIAAVIVIGAGSAKADFTLGEPTNLGPTVNDSSSADFFACPSADGLELYFVSDRTGGEGPGDLWVTRRASTIEPWEEPVNLGPPVNTPEYETGPTLSADGLELYFTGLYPDGFHILITKRPTRNSP